MAGGGPRELAMPGWDRKLGVRVGGLVRVTVIS